MGDDDPRGPEDDFAARLQRARSAEAQRSRGPGAALTAPTSGFGMAFRVGVELVAALIVGVGIGLLLDRWLGTGPWFLIVFFFVGAAAGVLNVYRAASGIGLAAGYPEKGNPAPESGNEDSTGSAESGPE